MSTTQICAYYYEYRYDIRNSRSILTLFNCIIRNMINLKQLRRDLNLTQSELQDILNVTQGFLSKVENGKEAFPASFYDKLCNKYGADIVDRYMIDDQEVKSIINEAVEFVNETSKDKVTANTMSFEVAQFILKFNKYGDVDFSKARPLGDKEIVTALSDAMIVEYRRLLDKKDETIGELYKELGRLEALLDKYNIDYTKKAI